MRSIIAEDALSALPIPALSPHPRLDRIAAATFEQLSAALIFLSVFDTDAFDHAMDVAESDDDNPGTTGGAEPVCAICNGKIASSWNEASSGGTTPATAQRSASSRSTTQAHAPAVTWLLAEDLQTQDQSRQAPFGAPSWIRRDTKWPV